MNTATSSRAEICGWLRALWILGVLSLLGTPASGQGARPDPEGTPTRVEMLALMLDFREINSAEQSFTANFFLRVEWQDDRLAHAEPAPISRKLDSVWHPRLQILNQERLWKTFPEEVEVSPTGEVVYRQRYYGTFSQPLDLASFPFDHHRFLIDLVATGYGPDEVRLVQNEALLSGLGPEFSLPDWAITSWAATSATYEALPGAPPTSSFVFSIAARRHFGYYFFKALLPLILVLAMSWIVFWIDSTQLSTRISVSVTSMLTLIAYRFMISGMLPKVSYLTRLDIIILGATLLVFATLLEAVVTSSMAQGGKVEKARAIDRKARWLAPLVFGIVVASALPW